MATKQANGLTKLDPKVWSDDIHRMICAQAEKKEADATSRAAKGVIDSIAARILQTMGDAAAAICGNAVLTRKSTSGAKAALTLTDGSKINWDDVTSVLVGNKTIMRADVATLYGGRSESISVEVKGTP